jgi:hypothetical protein
MSVIAIYRQRSATARLTVFELVGSFPASLRVLQQQRTCSAKKRQPDSSCLHSSDGYSFVLRLVVAIPGLSYRTECAALRNRNWNGG